MDTKRIFNFSAGPCCLPMEVLMEAKNDLLNYGNTGTSVMEMSHRSKEFINIYRQTVADLKEILEVPDSHHIFFMQGGATLQFACVPLNLFSDGNKSADFVVTGTWSDKACKEAKKYGSDIRIVADAKPSGYKVIPDPKTWVLNPKANFFHYCTNETIKGVEFHYTPEVTVPLVSDMSSDFCSRPIDVSKHSLIYAGVQKNLGPAGAAVVIASDEIVKRGPMDVCPTLLSYKTTVDSESMYNTPPCWTIYMTGLMAKYVKKTGGLASWSERTVKKASLLYDFVDSSNGYYSAPVDKSCRSNMNVPFRVAGGNADLEKLFVSEATKAKVAMTNLAGHRSVGGCRASIYNGMPVEGVQALVDFMKEFQEEHPIEMRSSKL